MTDSKPIDIICAGESLIDFIGNQEEHTIDITKDFHRYLGGSPTNVAMNLGRLGLDVVMVATVGQDGFGKYVISRLSETVVNTEHIRKIQHVSTSVIFLNRTLDTPEFIPHRGADFEIEPAQMPSALLASAKIFHTSCFALSREPARASIMAKAAEAVELGCTLSIDINYSEKIWPDTEDALEVVKAYCKLKPLVKVSQDDMDRLFGPGMDHNDIFDKLHSLGAQLVCLTLGNKGAKLSEARKEVVQVSALKVENMIDATGAGDAFWSGFLFGKINHKSNFTCLEMAVKLAAMKLQNVGRIPENALSVLQAP